MRTTSKIFALGLILLSCIQGYDRLESRYFIQISGQPEIEVFPKWGPANFASAAGMTAEFGYRLNRHISVAGALSYFSSAYHSEQPELVDASIFGTKAEYLKMGVVARISVYPIERVLPLLDPYLLTASGFLDGTQFYDGAGMAGPYSRSYDTDEWFLQVGGGVNLFKSKRLNYLIEYVHEWFIGDFTQHLIEMRDQDILSLGIRFNL